VAVEVDTCCDEEVGLRVGRNLGGMLLVSVWILFGAVGVPCALALALRLWAEFVLAAVESLLAVPLLVALASVQRLPVEEELQWLERLWTPPLAAVGVALEVLP